MLAARRDATGLVYARPFIAQPIGRPSARRALLGPIAGL